MDRDKAEAAHPCFLGAPGRLRRRLTAHLEHLLVASKSTDATYHRPRSAECTPCRLLVKHVPLEPLHPVADSRVREPAPRVGAGLRRARAAQRRHFEPGVQQGGAHRTPYESVAAKHYHTLPRIGIVGGTSPRRHAPGGYAPRGFAPPQRPRATRSTHAAPGRGRHGSRHRSPRHRPHHPPERPWCLD